MSGKNSIQVAIKVRPLLKKEKDLQPLWRVVDNSIQQTDSQTEPYYFDHIFDQDASNENIFEKMAKHIVHSAIQGFNGTIFAYGQTSSGKTYTMMGDDDNPGVMVLAAKDIFREIELATDRKFLIRVGYIEIYNEKIYDLLNKKNQDLKVHETSNGIITVSCEEIVITCEEDLLQHLTQGSKERTVGETNMNERSSRSHAIFRIIIESTKIDGSEDNAIIQSVLNLVDLAGSERADQTGARGTRLKEGGHINKSLLFLSNVIKRLSENEDHKYISYRDSKLTRILQASLGGNALTAIICTIKPTAIEETQSTLSFAMRAKTIKNKPQVNENVSDATMMKRLEREIKLLRTRLAEEQRKNESQIKVRQLEQRIRNEDLKIISCNSLHSGRNREKRRRTWCPSSNLNNSSTNIPSALPLPSFLSVPSNSGGIPVPSRLQPPKSSFYLTPLITMRPTEPTPAPKLSSGEIIDEIDEEFAPAEHINFDRLSPLLTPKSNFMPRCSMTPKVTSNPKLTLERVEHDLLELQSFTNLENKVDVQYETDLSLKQMVNTLTNRIAFLESERIEYIQNKDEISTTREQLSEYETRFDALQIQISKLTSSNKIANDKIAKYELELEELKKSNEKLEMENREAINIEFEFERHKNKSKLREKELIEALKEREKDVSKLEKSLKSISEDKFSKSKEDLLQLSLNECAIDENGKLCVKCEDLQRLLADNEKVTQEFAKLTLEYDQLRLNYQEIEKENEESKVKISDLEELQKNERTECEKLQKDLQELREKLQGIQSEYEQVNCENSSKTEECLALNRQVELARQEMVVLQEKYTKLELSWQEQQQTLKDIETQYAEIETKYKHLQSEYEQLELCKGQSVTDCERLQKENVDLQTEIVELKHKVQDVHQQLLENAEKAQENLSKATAKERDETIASASVQKENEQLKSQLLEIQTQFDDLQREYDDLSNQLMDNLQEAETVKEQNTKLEEQLKAFENKNAEVSKAEAEICELKSQLEKVLTNERKSLLYSLSPGRNSSMRSSGVCIEEESEFEESPGGPEDLLKKFYQLSESLTQIELEQQNGKRRVFKTPTSTAQTPNYKLYLRNIMGVNRIQKDFLEEMENIHLQGSFKQHSFHIVELGSQDDDVGHAEEDGKKAKEQVESPMQCEETETSDCVNCVEIIAKLQEQISDLRLLNEQERQSNKSLLENTERTLSEMREQITQLSAELLEKSMFVENCACKTYQKQIETLEKEKADITMVFEELQEKVSNCTFDGSALMMNCTLNGEKPLTATILTNDMKKDLELMQAKEREMLDNLDSQTRMLEELTQRNLDLESDLKSAQDQLEEQEKEYKDKCSQLQLEILGKMEMSANEYRDNMKKYNKEWEDRKESYEATIKEFEEELAKLKQDNEDAEVKAREIQEELVKVKDEFQLLQSEHTLLQQTLENIKDSGESSKEINNELQELQQKFEALQTQHQVQQEILQENQNAAEQLAHLQEEYQQLQNQYEDTLQKLQNNEGISKKLSQELEELTQNFALMQAENLQLQEQRKEHEEALKDNENAIKQYQQSVEQMTKLQEEYNEIKEQLKETLEKLKDNEATFREVNNNLDELKESYAMLQNQHLQLQEQRKEQEENLSEKENATAQAQKTQEQLEKVKEEYCQLQAELQQTVFNLKSTEESSSDICKELEKLKENFANLQEQYKQLEEQQSNHEEVSKGLAELKEKETLLLKEKQEMDANLLTMREECKQLNEQHNLIVQEKNTICHEKLKLQSKLSLLEEKLNSSEELPERLAKLAEEKEQLVLERQQILNKLQSKEMQIQEYCSEDLQREEMIKTFQVKIVNLEALGKEKENLFKSLEKEKTEVNNKLETLREEKQTLEHKLVDLSEREETQQKHFEMQLSSLQQEKYNLQEQKSLLEEQLKTLEIQVEEKKALEKKLEDYEELQKKKAECEEKLKSLETEVEEKKTLEAKLKDYVDMQKRNTELEEQLKTLETAVAEKKALEDHLEELQKSLETVNKERNDLEAKLQQINDNHNENLKTVDNLQEQILTLEEKLKDFDNVKQESKVLQEQFVSLQENSKSIEENLQQNGEEKEKLQIEITALSDKATAQNEELQRTLNTLAELKERDTAHVKENEILQEKLTSLTNSSSNLELEKCSIEKQLQQCNEELQQLTHEKGALENQLTHITEEKKTLSEQCSLFNEEISTLKEQLKCLKEKEKAEELLEQMINEKSELSLNLRLTNEKLDAKQQEFVDLQQENQKSKHDIELLKCSLNNVNREKETLESELLKYQELAKEKSKLEATIGELKTAQSEALSVLKQERGSLQLSLAKYEHEISLYKQNEDTLRQKVEKLSQELHELRSKAKSYEALMQEHEEAEKSLNAVTKQNTEFSNEIQNMKSFMAATTQTYQETSQKQTAHIQELDSQLLLARQTEKDLRSKLSQIEENLQDQQSLLQRETLDLKSSLAELQLKCTSLQASNTQLQSLNQHLGEKLQQSSQQLQDNASVQGELSSLKAQYADLQRKMEATVEEAGRCSRALREDLQHHKQLLETQLETYNALRLEMNTKEHSFAEEKEQLTSTIATLQSTTACLEEKIREITVNNFKQDLERQAHESSTNTSIDGNTSSSPRPRRSIESMNISIEDKLCASASQQKVSQQSNERKNRRLSTFDERRRQSYWGVAHDKQTMTDPVDTSCNCVELDRKLKECERNLFIRESQVTALSMELKNHPLKDENAALMKRLQEEQDKNRIEIKRYKQKIYEQTQKAEKALAAMAQAESKATIAPPPNTAAVSANPPAAAADMSHAETQTDGDLSTNLTTLQGKYNDLINICRHRKSVIKDLEERVAQKENADGNSMNALEVGQVRLLKSQCESMKKELKIVKEKYENAKIVLHTRREEIHRLRSQLEQS